MRKLLSFVLMLVSCHIYGQDTATENYSLKGLADYLNNKKDVEVSDFNGGIAIVDYEIDGVKKQDIITTMGNVLSSNGGYIVSKGLVMVPADNGNGLVLKNTEGSILTKNSYDNIFKEREFENEKFENGFLRVRRNGKFGFVDKLGTEIIPCKYSKVDPFKNDVARVWGEVDETYGARMSGYVNKDGKEIVPCLFMNEGDLISWFSNEYANYKYNNKYGIVDKTGNVVVSFSYDYAFNFNEGLAAVIKDGKLGFVDNNNNIVIPCMYDNEGYDFEYSYKFSDGLAAVKKEGKWGYIDKSNNVIIPFIYSEVEDFHNGLALVTDNDGNKGCIDTTGKVVVPYSDTEGIEYLGDGFYKCANNSKVNLINKSGIIGVYDTSWNSSGVVYKDGLFFVGKNKKCGIVDASGKEIIPCIYKEINYCENSHSIMKAKDENGKTMFFNRKGLSIIPSSGKYESLKENIVKYKIDNKFGYISVSGDEIAPCIYDYANEFKDGYAIVGKNNLCGVIDSKGKEIIPIIYQFVCHFDDGLAVVIKDDVLGIVDTKGDSTFDLK